MAIGDKTRRTLWARSGNMCAICKTELVAEQNAHGKNLNVGDECHIVSERINGPRHLTDFGDKYDNYENLILLCKNHHKTIDELWETFTVEILISIKSTHEEWTRKTLENAKHGQKNKPSFLPRLREGKEIVDVIFDVHAYQFDHDPFKSSEEAEFVSGFLDNLKEWSELAAMVGFEFGERAKFGFKLNKEIQEVEKHQFLIFGKRWSERTVNNKGEDLGDWYIATIIILRSDNPAIINAEGLDVSIGKVQFTI
jgi:hypothetical protein